MTGPKASAFDSMASEYDSWFQDKGRLIFAVEAQAFEEAVPLLPKPWLEIGVGSGRFAQALQIENGLDLSIELLKMAGNRGISTFLGTGEASPFKSDTFGEVFLIATLCFVDSPLKVLMEANRLLRQGGGIVLGLVLQESPWGQFYEMKKEAGHHFYKHATFCSYAELQALQVQASSSIG